jgi:amino acid transporter
VRRVVRVGRRAINPYLGFMTGWLMIAGSLIGTVSGVVVLAPSVLAIGGASTAARWPNVGLDTAVVVIMLVIAIAGIRITARAQVSMAAIEYVILIGFAVLGLVFVFSHHHGTYPATSGWLSLPGVRRRRSGRSSGSSPSASSCWRWRGWC